MGAAVGRVGAPLDHAGRGELVDQANQGDRRDVKRFGELVLLRSLAALQARQDGPLGAGGVELARAMVRIGAQHARRVVEGKSHFPPA